MLYPLSFLYSLYYRWRIWTAYDRIGWTAIKNASGTSLGSCATINASGDKAIVPNPTTNPIVYFLIIRQFARSFVRRQRGRRRRQVQAQRPNQRELQKKKKERPPMSSMTMCPFPVSSSLKCLLSFFSRWQVLSSPIALRPRTCLSPSRLFLFVSTCASFCFFFSVLRCEKSHDKTGRTLF